MRQDSVHWNEVVEFDVDQTLRLNRVWQEIMEGQRRDEKPKKYHELERTENN